MKQYLYPATVHHDDDKVVIFFPDLDINAEASSVEEAFLFAKDYLRVYLCYALKFELEFNLPTAFDKIQNTMSGHVILIDAFITDKDIKNQ